MNALELLPGERGIIEAVESEELDLKLMEMGCYPGNEIALAFKAPLGDPVCYQVAGYFLALRGHEAEKIIITRLAQ